jgi:RNA-directed DNA polymerase
MLIQELNQHLRGWANYFRFGYPSVAFEKINHQVHVRLQQNLKRRSQRRYRPPQHVSTNVHFQQLGLRPLRTVAAQLPVRA